MLVNQWTQIERKASEPGVASLTDENTGCSVQKHGMQIGQKLSVTLPREIRFRDNYQLPSVRFSNSALEQNNILDKLYSYTFL
jgi:hypothetical protein